MSIHQPIPVDSIKEGGVVRHGVFEVNKLHVDIVREDGHLVSTQSVQPFLTR